MMSWPYPYRALAVLFLAIQPTFATLHAQNSDRQLLHADAKWDIALKDDSQFCPWVSGHTWKIIGDTSINGQVYSRVGKSPVHAVNSPPFCAGPYIHGPDFLAMDHYLREDTTAGIVYYFSPALADEIVLYDWNMVPGDTLDDFFPDPDDLVIVNGMDSAQLSNGTYRKRWYLHSWWYGELIDMPEVVEGIGSSIGLLHFSPRYYGNGSHLWCYQRDGLHMGSPNYCTGPSPLGAENPQGQQDVPGIHQTENTLIVSWPEPVGPIHMRVISLEGRILYEGQGYGTTRIGTSHCAEGIYVLHSTDGSGRTWSLRFMKH